MRRFLPAPELVLAALVVAASCVVHPDAPTANSRQGTVVDVRHYISDDGEPMVRVTVSTQTAGTEGMVYENDTIAFPATSREAVLFGRRGACAEVAHWGQDVRLSPCR